MTQRLTISVPDDLASVAAASGNASKWFTDAGRSRLTRQEYLQAGRDHMAATGVRATPDGARRAGAVVRAASARMSPQAWTALSQGPQAYREYLAAQAAAEPATPAETAPGQVA